MNVKKVIGGIIAIVSSVTAIGTTKYLWDNHHYNSEGYNKKGYDKNGFNKDGYNTEGYDHHGFDRNGYNKDGYDHQGFDIDGYDRDGFDCEGFDREGFDRSHLDRDGYNKIGYDIEGYDREGKDRQGYFKSGYNSEGVDRGGKSFDFYIEEANKINAILEKALVPMKKYEFGYALHDIRIGLEKGVKCIIIHWKGSSYIQGRLDDNISVCKKYSLLPQSFIEELYDAKNHCNSLQHDTNIQKDYGQVHFTYKVLEELNEKIKDFV